MKTWMIIYCNVVLSPFLWKRLFLECFLRARFETEWNTDKCISFITTRSPRSVFRRAPRSLGSARPLVLDDPSESFQYAAQETFLIIINVDSSCAASYFCGNLGNNFIFWIFDWIVQIIAFIWIIFCNIIDVLMNFDTFNAPLSDQ